MIQVNGRSDTDVSLKASEPPPPAKENNRCCWQPASCSLLLFNMTASKL